MGAQGAGQHIELQSVGLKRKVKEKIEYENGSFMLTVSEHLQLIIYIYIGIYILVCNILVYTLRSHWHTHIESVL